MRFISSHEFTAHSFVTQDTGPAYCTDVNSIHKHTITSFAPHPSQHTTTQVFSRVSIHSHSHHTKITDTFTLRTRPSTSHLCGPVLIHTPFTPEAEAYAKPRIVYHYCALPRAQRPPGVRAPFSDSDTPRARLRATLLRAQRFMAASLSFRWDPRLRSPVGA
jgi:hypothetical protein